MAWKRKHSMSKSVEYGTWIGIKRRCLDTKDASYKNYWWRGIKVCPEWLECFQNFYADMWPRPEWKTIERIDVNWDYCAKNCKWATKKEQWNNRRNNVFCFYRWEKITISSLSERTGIKRSKVSTLLRKWILPDQLNSEIKKEETEDNNFYRPLVYNISKDKRRYLLEL